MEMDMEDKSLYRLYQMLGKYFNEKYRDETFVTAAEKTKQPVPTVEKQQTLQQIQTAFNQELRELLSFEETDNHIIVKPKKYLSTEFGKVSAVVGSLNGQYVSAGRNSHFKIPK